MQRASTPPDLRPVILAIAGDSASGKTTLTKGLVAALGEEVVGSFCVDDYHCFDRTERASMPYTPLNPECNYVGIMEQHLQLLAMGETVLKPVYNHHEGTLDRPVLFEPRQHVIVEGLLPLYTRLSRSCFDLSVYLEPIEETRKAWKVKRDTQARGYNEEQVLAELVRREPESELFIRPQRSWADIVVRFAPIVERGEDPRGLMSASILLRPTAPHPEFSLFLNDDTREAIHLKLERDIDGRPVDVLHVHSYASPDAIRRVKEGIWSQLDLDEEMPDSLGLIEPGVRSQPLAVVQLILLFDLMQARRVQLGDLRVAP
jgi:phosphoribulokinase